MRDHDEEEEKEELKENDLLNWFQYGLPIFLKQNGSYILLLLALSLLGYQLYNWHEKKQAIEIQSAWNELQNASNPGVVNQPEKLAEIISQYNVKPVQAMAWLQIGSFYLDDVAHGNPPEGYQGVKLSREDSLKKADEAYHTVLSDFPDESLATGKAHLGVGTVALDRGDWDSAKKEFDLLADKSGPYAGTPFAIAAEIQLRLLDSYKKTPRLAALAPVLTTQQKAAADNPTPDFPSISPPLTALSAPSPVGPALPTTAPATHP